jgi:TRAP-type C4-dicarboxylate transport system substrate-binding protein
MVSVLKAQFEAVAAIPQVLPFSEVSRGQQQRAVEDQENIVSNSYTKTFHEVRDDMTLNNHGYLGYMQVTNQILWSKLPSDRQETLMACVEEAADFTNERAKPDWTKRSFPGSGCSFRGWAVPWAGAWRSQTRKRSSHQFSFYPDA